MNNVSFVLKNALNSAGIKAHIIPAKTEKSKQIIQAIKDNVRTNTPSDAVVFSLPVQEVAGLITT